MLQIDKSDIANAVLDRLCKEDESEWSCMMSKKLIQTKLGLFSSQPDIASNKEKKLDLKRMRSDSSVDENSSKPKKIASYADVTAGNITHHSSGHNKRMDQTNGHQGMRYDADETTRATQDSIHQAPKSHEHKERISYSSEEAEGYPTEMLVNTMPPTDKERPSCAPYSIMEENDGHASNVKRSDSETEEPQGHTSSSNEEENDGHASNVKRSDSETEEPQGPRSLHEVQNIFKGVPIDTLERAPECFRKKGISLPPLKPSATHKVFFKIPQVFVENKKLKPYSKNPSDVWDNDHVYMPNRKQNKMPEVLKEDDERIICRWDKIWEVLNKKIVGSFELQETILSYNLHYKRKWNFEALHKYFQFHDSGIKIRYEFFGTILPKMQALALQLAELFPKAIPILKKRENMKLTFSQEQVACLLANAFFCTFPKRNFKVKFGSRLPDINFSHLFAEQQHGVSRKFEKFSCIINYFQRVTNAMPNGSVTYARQFTPQQNDFWSKMDKKFTNVHVSTTGTIEDEGRGMLQADFANKYVGGGVLGHGLVQEEIRFLICPEMIVSRLFTEALSDDEVLIMTGCERFSKYTGYSDTFKYRKNYEDLTERDEWGRRCTEVVAMDALIIPRKSEIEKYLCQFEKDKVFRELNKAYCAFRGSEIAENLPAVCTGNWGCGAFGGEKELKAIIQLMAASAAGRDVCYLTFGDNEICNRIGQIYNLLKKEDITVGNALDFIKGYHDELKKKYDVSESLFEYIAKMLGSKIEHSSEN